jgi:hypothetical protein
MKKTICISLILLASILLNAQDKFYMRSDIGLSHAVTISNTAGITGDFNSQKNIFPNCDAIWGLYLGGSVYKNLNIEMGFKCQMFSDRCNVQLENIRFSREMGGSDAFIIIPLNLSYNYRIAKSKFYVVPHLGVSFINRLEKENYITGITFDNMESSGSLGIIGETIKYSEFPAEPSNDFCFLFNAGIGMEYRIHDRWGITLDGNYSQGFNEIDRYVILIKDNNGNIQGVLSYKGTHYSLAGGVKYYF